MANVKKIIFKIFKACFFVCLLGLFLSVIAIFSLPYLLSSPWGQRVVESWINRQIPGQIHIEKLDLSWLGQQKLSGILLQDPNGQTILSLDSLDLKVRLIDLFPKPSNELFAQVSGLTAILVPDQQGGSNLQQSLGLPLPLSHASSLHAIEVRNASGLLHLKAPDLTIQLAGTTLMEDQTGHFDIDVALNQDNISHLSAHISQLPVEILEQFITLVRPDLAGVLEAIFGKSIDVTLHHSKDMPYPHLNMNMHSGHLNIDLTGRLVDHTFVLEQPTVLKIALTPELIRFLKTSQQITSSWDLTQPLVVNLYLNQLSLPLSDEGFSHFLKGLALNVRLEIPSSELSVQPLDFMIDKPLHSTQIAVHSKVKIEAKDHEAPLTFQAHYDVASDQLQLLLNIETQLKASVDIYPWRANPLIKAHIQASHFPIALTQPLWRLVGMADRLPQVEAALGSLVNGEAQVQLQQMAGPVRLHIIGEKGQVLIDGNLAKQGMRLNKPFLFEVEATPQLDQAVLHKVLPILSGLIRADQRLRVTIDPEGFLFPLSKFDLNSIEIGRLSLDLGRSYFSERGQVGKMMSLLKVRPEGLISLWFTPIYAGLHQGLLTVERFDLLAMHKYPIAIWGHIHFPKDQVNLIAGLNGHALQELTGFSIPDSENIQFPLTGKINDINIDKSAALTRVAALAAQQSQDKKGAILGAFLEMAAGTLEQDVPEPTTYPLPWETEKQEKVSKNTRAKSKIDPLKVIEKSANSFLNKMLKD
jgi:hypothetical protein